MELRGILGIEFKAVEAGGTLLPHVRCQNCRTTRLGKAHQYYGKGPRLTLLCSAMLLDRWRARKVLTWCWRKDAWWMVAGATSIPCEVTTKRMNEFG
jgi:hypothetical protein